MSQQTNVKLYVGSLPYSTSEDELREIFSNFGEVISVRIIIDKFTGKSKGFGFVEMTDKVAAEKAIESVHGSELKGRTLIVNEARSEQPRERFQRNSYGDQDAPRGRFRRG